MVTYTAQNMPVITTPRPRNFHVVSESEKPGFPYNVVLYIAASPLTEADLAFDEGYPIDPRDYRYELRCDGKFKAWLDRAKTESPEGIAVDGFTQGTTYKLGLKVTTESTSMYRSRVFDPSDPVEITYTTKSYRAQYVPKISKEGIIAAMNKRDSKPIDTGAISKFVGHDKWYMYRSGLYYKSPSTGKEITIQNLSTRNPPTQVGDISLTENATSVGELDKEWVLARLAELSYTAPFAVPSAEQTEMCKWIKSLMAKGLTEDHGRYVYQLAKGRATLAASIFVIMRVAPFMLPTIKVSEVIGRAIYQYAKGRKSLGNKIMGCDF